MMIGHRLSSVVLGLISLTTGLHELNELNNVLTAFENLCND